MEDPATRYKSFSYKELLTLSRDESLSTYVDMLDPDTRPITLRTAPTDLKNKDVSILTQKPKTNPPCSFDDGTKVVRT